MSLDEMVAIEKIRQLKARYFRTLDEQDWRACEELLTENARIDTTSDGAPLLIGGQAFGAFLGPILTGVCTVHHGHSSEITITGPGGASGIWAMEDNLWFPAEKGGVQLRGFGWYREQYLADAAGVWRIDAMQLVRIRVEADGVPIDTASKSV